MRTVKAIVKRVINNVGPGMKDVQICVAHSNTFKKHIMRKVKDFLEDKNVDQEVRDFSQRDYAKYEQQYMHLLEEAISRALKGSGLSDEIPIEAILGKRDADLELLASYINNGVGDFLRQHND